MQDFALPRSRWGVVLTALYHANKFTSPEELVQLSEQDIESVKAALQFLLKHGWIEQLADDEKYACVAQARTVMQSLEKASPSL